jgi:hypothetical protein
MTPKPKASRAAEDARIGRSDEPYSRVQVAFTSPSWEAVDAFHAAALAAGDQDNGALGPRPEYHDGYYAGSVLNAGDNNVEAVHYGRP